MTQTHNFADFQVGDFAIFDKRFDADAFAAFSDLSGDANPLHHDAAYAAASEFEKPIVPMHMTMAPMSRIAGMIFPGDPSLYLGHEIRSSLPVFYGDQMTYSAQVIAINPTLRTLTIRVLVCRDADVVLDAEMRVMSRVETWEATANASDHRDLPVGYVLITGATGEIGTALSLAAAHRGCNLLLVDRGAGTKRTALADVLKPVLIKGQQVVHLTADLADADAVTGLCADLVKRGDVAHVIHAASPPLDASLGDLVQVNFAALRDISQAVLPSMLIRQGGQVVNIGTVATERVIAGWENYSAVKAMTTQFVTRFDKSHATFGVRGLNVIAGLVATAYSADVQGDSPAMLPQELADHVMALTLDDHAGQSVMVEWNDQRAGQYGFSTGSIHGGLAPVAAAGVVAEGAAPVASLGGDVADQISNILRNRLRLPADASLAGGGVGITQGWDSLRHIELVLELEGAFNIRYNAQDMEKVMMYDALVTVTKDRVGQAGQGR